MRQHSIVPVCIKSGCNKKREHAVIRSVRQKYVKQDWSQSDDPAFNQSEVYVAKWQDVLNNRCLVACVSNKVSTL